MYKAQPGFQTAALSTPADGAIIGGSAGGGKTFLKLLESTRHVKNPNFGFIGFRRTTTQIRAQGGLWDTSRKIYTPIDAVPRENDLTWKFPSGASGKFAHLEYDKNADDYQGSQIPLILFDELTHFSEYQFWKIISRNRSDCGVRPYWRASCNPDPGSFVARFISWWIDQETGFPIKERAGKIRWYTRDGDAVIWGDTPQEVISKCPHIFDVTALHEAGVRPRDLVKSFTFIPGSIYENKIFIKQDPGYLGNLLSLPAEERIRLLDGNWKITLDGLMIPEYQAIENIFSNYPEGDTTAKRYITCDAARFGRDFCVIKYWKGWECLFMIVIKYSDSFDIVKQIEFLRQKFSVTSDNVVVDQDGVGDGAIKLGNYTGFHGGHPAIKDPESRTKENYQNLKTQCYYRFCQLRINTGQVRYNLNSQNVLIFDGTYQNGLYTTKIKVGSEVKDVRDLIKEDFRTVRRAETINDGTDKLRMVSKEEQKNRLGRSPDFGDCSMMREFCELKPKAKKIVQLN